jgi:hypothetical protein
MGPIELNGLFGINNLLGSTELTNALAPGIPTTLSSVDGNEGPGGGWENAWIDLGGEG